MAPLLHRAAIKMLDGYESGMSSARESCKSTKLKRCIATEMRCNKYELSISDIARL